MKGYIISFFLVLACIVAVVQGTCFGDPSNEDPVLIEVSVFINVYFQSFFFFLHTFLQRHKMSLEFVVGMERKYAPNAQV